VAGPEQPNEQHNALTCDQDDLSEDSWQLDEVLAAQGLLEGACHDNELPNFVNQLKTAMLDCSHQIEHKMANELNEDLIWLCHSCAAMHQMSNGDLEALCRCRQDCQAKELMLLMAIHILQSFIVKLTTSKNKKRNCDIPFPPSSKKFVVQLRHVKAQTIILLVCDFYVLGVYVGMAGFTIFPMGIEYW